MLSMHNFSQCTIEALSVFLLPSYDTEQIHRHAANYHCHKYQLKLYEQVFLFCHDIVKIIFLSAP